MTASEETPVEERMEHTEAVEGVAAAEVPRPVESAEETPLPEAQDPQPEAELQAEAPEPESMAPSEAEPELQAEAGEPEPMAPSQAEPELQAEAPEPEPMAPSEAELELQAEAEALEPAQAAEGVPAAEVTEAEGAGAPARVEEPDDDRQWYVVHCYSGYENKVRHNLEQRIETMNMKDKIFDVVVPTEEEMEVKDGKRRTVERRVFPGYILVQMLMDEDSWYVVRNTPGVTGFVGMGNEPTPLRPEEVAQIVKRMEAEAPRIKVTYKTGQKVRIIDGPFNDFIGTVDNIDMDKAKVRVMVSFFGRETPVELDFLQVEKA
jgi:transcriptional antiterminator NusG